MTTTMIPQLPLIISRHELPDIRLAQMLNENEEVEPQRREEEEKMLLCASCRHPITSNLKRVAVNGLQQHGFINPAGIVFHLACFSAAPGCVNSGAPTSQHSWFAGFTWVCSFCANCRAHLGWYYQSWGQESFYGLILANLRDGN